MITGKQNERKSFTNDLMIGFFEAKVVGICPTKEELITLLNVSNEHRDKFEDPSYTSKEGDINKVYIDVWLEDVKTLKISKKRFFIENRVRKSKDGLKTQYINNIGATTWVIDEKDLPTWFTKREYREAYAGEDIFYDFLKNWFGNLDIKDPETQIYLDNKKLFAGNFKEIKCHVGNTDLTTTVVAMMEVKSHDVNGELKQKQNIYDKFLPGYTMRTIANSKFTSENIELWRSKIGIKGANGEKVYLKNYEKFMCEITDNNYGSKNYFLLEPLQKYDSSKNSFVSEKVLITEDEADY